MESVNEGYGSLVFVVEGLCGIGDDVEQVEFIAARRRPIEVPSNARGHIGEPEGDIGGCDRGEYLTDT